MSEKKYRLEIPRSNDFYENLLTMYVKEVGKWDEKILCEDAFFGPTKITSNGVDFDVPKITIHDIPSSWLTEIKEPLSFEEWNKENFIEVTNELLKNKNLTHLSKQDKKHREEGWNAALENQRIKRGVYNDDNKFLTQLLEDLKVGMFGCGEDQKWGLTLYSDKDEAVPITKEDLCYFFSMGLKYARGIK